MRTGTASARTTSSCPSTRRTPRRSTRTPRTARPGTRSTPRADRCTRRTRSVVAASSKRTTPSRPGGSPMGSSSAPLRPCTRGRRLRPGRHALPHGVRRRRAGGAPRDHHGPCRRGEESHDPRARHLVPVSYTHLRAHETKANLVCRLLLEKKKKKRTIAIKNETNTEKEKSTNKTNKKQ